MRCKKRVVEENPISLLNKLKTDASVKRRGSAIRKKRGSELSLQAVASFNVPVEHLIDEPELWICTTNCDNSIINTPQMKKEEVDMDNVEENVEKMETKEEEDEEDLQTTIRFKETNPHAIEYMHDLLRHYKDPILYPHPENPFKQLRFRDTEGYLDSQRKEIVNSVEIQDGPQQQQFSNAFGYDELFAPSWNDSSFAYDFMDPSSTQPHPPPMEEEELFSSWPVLQSDMPLNQFGYYQPD